MERIKFVEEEEREEEILDNPHIALKNGEIENIKNFI
jgi:hypothetical protein